MGGMQFATSSGDPIEVASEVFRHLEHDLDGRLVQRGADGYDAARRCWNGMVDKRPAAIAYCANESDVAKAVTLARDKRIAFSVRSGGHNIAGNCVCDAGLVIDLSAMKGIEVDAEQRLARAESGLLLGEFDAATQRHGLATTMGINSDTGIAGLTLGGGFGRLGRKHGLTCDNLVSVRVVSAEGNVLTANDDENSDLFWALRGGGGNFGVVTRFDYRLWPIGPNVLGGLLIYDYGQAKDVLRTQRELFADGRDDLDIDIVLLTTPEGGKVLALSVCYVGTMRDGERLLAPLKSAPSLLADQVGPVSYVELQGSADSLFERGRRYYWRANFLRELTDAAIDAFVDEFADVPSAQSLAVMQQVGGAISSVPADATAFWNRDAAYDCFPVSVWEAPHDDARQIDWARRFSNVMAEHATGGVYVNALGDEGEVRVRAAYGGNYERLVAVKRRYDPDNLFRQNQNIRPDS